jgi:hypothetical protein
MSNGCILSCFPAGADGVPIRTKSTERKTVSEVRDACSARSRTYESESSGRPITGNTRASETTR